LPGVDLEAVEGPVSAADDHLTDAVDRRDDRARVVGVVVAHLRGTHPDRLSGGLVERKIPIARTPEVTPTLQQRVEDHLVAVDDRRGRTATVSGDGAVLFR